MSASKAHEWGIPVFISTFIFRAVAHESDIPLWKLLSKITLTTSMYSMHFAEVKNLFLCVTDHQRLNVRELFMDRDSEGEPDASDDDSDSSFAPEEENSDSDGSDADRPSCLYLLSVFLYTHSKPSTPETYLGRGKHSFSIYLAGIVLRLITTHDLKATSVTVPMEKQQATTLPSASLYLSLLAEVDSLSVLSFLEGQPAQQQHDAGTKRLVRKCLQSTQQ